MRRREFITLFSGTVALPLAATHAQQSEKMRRVGVLLSLSPDDQEAQARYAAFLQELQLKGWAVGQNLRIATRWGAGNPDDTRRYAAELVELSPDAIFAAGNASIAPLLQLTRTVPIVFAVVSDPVGAGFVDNLAQPRRNATGFTNFDYAMSAKWLELLKQIAPQVTRVAVIRDASLASGSGQFGAIQSVAPALGIEVSPINLHEDNDELERAITDFGRSPNAGLTVVGSALAIIHRKVIISAAALHRLPAVYFLRDFVVEGGLMSYSPDYFDQYRQAAAYVDRILRGERPADLPVQAPTKYETVINLKTAKALALTVPPSLLATADEVIE